MAINKLVSIDNVIVDLMDDLGLDHNKYRPMFTNWAVLAEKKIGSQYALVRKHAVLTIKGCVAELPCDAVYMQLALLGDYGCDCGDLFRNVCGRVFVTAGVPETNSFLVVDIPSDWTNGNYSFGFIDHHIQDNNLIFDVNMDGQSVTIQYVGLETDENGIPKIGQNHVEAIGEFCQWKFKRRKIRDWLQKKLADDHFANWENLCLCARGDDAEPTESERQNIVNMLHDPYIGIGCPLVPNAWGNM